MHPPKFSRWIDKQRTMGNFSSRRSIFNYSSLLENFGTRVGELAKILLEQLKESWSDSSRNTSRRPKEEGSLARGMKGLRRQISLPKFYRDKTDFARTRFHESSCLEGIIHKRSKQQCPKIASLSPRNGYTCLKTKDEATKRKAALCDWGNCHGHYLGPRQMIEKRDPIKPWVQLRIGWTSVLDEQDK